MNGKAIFCVGPLAALGRLCSCDAGNLVPWKHETPQAWPIAKTENPRHLVVPFFAMELHWEGVCGYDVNP